MKKMLVSAVFFLSLSSQAFAFMPQMQYFVNREIAISRVWNTSFHPIVCSGQAFGRTWQGMTMNAWINGVVVYPNTTVDIYVTSNFYDPMVQAWAQIDCQFWY